MDLLKRLMGSASSASAPQQDAAKLSPEARLIQGAFWMLLGREAQPIELRDELRALHAGDRQAFFLRLLSSTEFRQGLAAWKAGRSRRPDVQREDAALRALGPDDWFVDRAYEFLLGRPADDEGRRHYVAALAAGDSRSHMLRWLSLSEEFERRYQDLSAQGGFIPRDTQLCELANPAKWDNPDWMTLLLDLKVVPADKASMHRKGYEFTQLIFGLGRLGRLRDDVRVLSVGAGHEAVLYWLANHTGPVTATDMYEEGRWDAIGAMEGDQRVMHRPQEYAPFPYREDRLRFLKMDGRHLGFRAASFDVAYSLSSIEHFGGATGAAAAVDEMVRVVKPGGLLVLATEYLLSGPPHEEVFTPDEIHALARRPGLRLLQPIDEAVYRRYEYGIVDLVKNRFQTPHMVLRMGDTVFTTVMMFLERE